MNNPTDYVDDFDFFFDIDRDPSLKCLEILITIYHNGNICFQGYFTTNKGKFDVDSCQFKVTPEPNDKYRDIFNGWKVEYNILDIETTVTVYSPNRTDPSGPYTRCRWLMDTIEFLAQKLIPTATIQSAFFDSTDGTDDYVTKTTTNINHIAIAQKSDIITPGSSEPATKAMLSFSGLMDIPGIS